MVLCYYQDGPKTPLHGAFLVSGDLLRNVAPIHTHRHVRNAHQEETYEHQGKCPAEAVGEILGGDFRQVGTQRY